MPLILLALFALGTVQSGNNLVQAAHALPPAPQPPNPNLMPWMVWADDPQPRPDDKVCCKCVGLQCLIDR